MRDDPSHANPLWALGLIAGVILAGLGVIWVMTADLRARTETRALLRDLAEVLLESEDHPGPGPVGLRDGWGNEIRHREDVLGRWLTSPGPDGVHGNLDDETRPISLSPLGQLLHGDDPLLRDRLRDPATLEKIGEETFGQPVSVEISYQIEFRSAGGEILYQLDLEELELLEESLGPR